MTNKYKDDILQYVSACVNDKLLFQRSAKGMVLTPDGEEFMDYARDILNRIGKLEQSYRDGSHKKRNFSVSVPRACYISEAMAEFSKNIGDTISILKY